MTLTKVKTLVDPLQGRGTVPIIPNSLIFYCTRTFYIHGNIYLAEKNIGQVLNSRIAQMAGFF
jgi:hypothetical protein